MTDFKIRRGLYADLFNIATGELRGTIEVGCWYLCTDSAELFLGMPDGTLKRINGNGTTGVTPDGDVIWVATAEINSNNELVITYSNGASTVLGKVASIDDVTELSNAVANLDASIPLWAREQEKPEYTANEVGAMTAEQVSAAIADLVDSAPETLNTLKELATALGDDPNFATTIANQIGVLENKVGKESVADQISEALLQTQQIQFFVWGAED